MRRSRIRSLRLIAGSLLLAAFCLPFVEVSDLLEDVWDDSPAGVDTDGCRLVRRPPETPDSPDRSTTPGLFGLAPSLPLPGPGLGLATGLAPTSTPRPARLLNCPRDVERGPPASA